MTKRQGVKALIFILVLALCLGIANRMLFPFSEHDTNQTKTFYRTEENSVDVLAIGTSLMMMSFNPLRMYEDTGVLAYNRACSCQSPQIAYLTVKETLETQKPKVLICTAGSLVINYDYEFREPFLRRGMDYKKMSFDKIEAARDIAAQSGDQTTASYIFPLLRYHSRWPELFTKGVDSFEYKYDHLRGYYPAFYQEAMEDVSAEKMANHDKYVINDNTRYWYDRIIELCKENDIKVLFIGNVDLRWTAGKHDCVEEYCKEKGVDFVDYNISPMRQQTGLDWSSDFYDKKHTNVRGSLKFTDCLSQYIVTKYNLKASDVSPELKSQLEKDIEFFKADIAEQNKKGFKVSW